ncbi:MAG: hypothetical protein ACLRZ9_01375 [Eubacterium sp.]
MVLKEFKKIFLNKWIIFLLILLCFINVFLNIKITDKDKENIQQEYAVSQEKIDEYGEYIDNVRENAKIISSFELFNEGSDYQTKSAEKIVKAYDNVKNVKPVYGNYVAVGKFTNIGFTDIIIFIVMLQCTMVLINTDVKNGMLILLKSCKRGRVRLVLGKIGALFLADLIVTFSVMFVHGISLYAAYGCSSLTVPLQSVSEFYESFLPITIIQYIVLFFIFKIFAVFTYSLMIFFLAVICRNSGIIYSITGVIILISFITYTRILWDYATALFKIISPITLIDIKAVTCKYYNMNILGNPISIMAVAILCIILYIVILEIASVVMFSNNINIALRLKKKLCLRKNKEKHVKGMLSMEYKKLLITNKGIIILLILILLQSFIVQETDTELSEEQLYYAHYIDDIEGEQSKQTNDYISLEKKRYKTLNADYEKNTELFNAGKIDAMSMAALQEQYDWEMRKYPSFEKVKAHKKYLDSLEKEQNIKGWFVNDIGINYIIHPELIYSENIAWIFMMMAIILLVTSCMGYEEQTGMEHLTDTMTFGKKKLLKKKVMVTTWITTLIFIISNLPYFLLMKYNYKFSGVMAPIKSLEEFEHFALNIPIAVYLILLYITKFIFTLFVMVLVIVIARQCRGYIKKVAISVTLIIVPMLIFTVL